MNMKRLAATLKMHTKTFYREKAALFFTFFFPVLLMILFGFIFQDMGQQPVVIHIQDLDDTDLSQNFTESLKNIKTLEVHKVGKNKDVDKYMKDNEVNFLIIIPQGYQDTIIAKNTYDPNVTFNLTVKYDPSVASTAIKLGMLNGILQEMNKGLAGAEDTIMMETESIVAEDFDYIEFFIPGVIALTVMTSAVFGTILDDNEFKQKGIYRKLSTTPITRAEWIFSNMLYQLFLAMLSTAMILIVGYLVFGAVMIINIWLPILITCEAFGFSGLGMLAGRAVKEAQSGSALANVITFPMMFLSGTFFPVEQMPDFLKVVAQALPLYYVNEGLREAMLFENHAAAGYNALVIMMFSVVIFTLGVYLTNWKQE